LILWDVAVLLRKANGASGAVAPEYADNFLLAINDDMNLPSALSTLHEVLASTLSPADKLATLKIFDSVLGLELFENAEKMMAVSNDILETQTSMEKARTEKDFKKSDELRAQIEMLGYVIRDGILLKTIKLLIKE
jgi:cysteinyl-tRNA synthetase